MPDTPTPKAPAEGQWQELAELRHRTIKDLMAGYIALAEAIEDDRPENADHIPALVSVIKSLIRRQRGRIDDLSQRVEGLERQNASFSAAYEWRGLQRAAEWLRCKASDYEVRAANTNDLEQVAFWRNLMHAAKDHEAAVRAFAENPECCGSVECGDGWREVACCSGRLVFDARHKFCPFCGRPLTVREG